MGNFIIRKLCPKGIYDYVIPRTKIVDEIFLNAISNNFDQILLLGAGFDTRGLRLVDENAPQSIFELDVTTTISDKLKQYKKRNIDPGKIKYVEIDFNTEQIEDKLSEAGFKSNKKTLYILEGITMYLNEDAINEDFKFIKKTAGENSEVVFDYIYQSVLNQENLYYGEQEIYQRVKKDGEGWTFGIEKGKIEEFLQKRGFELIEHFNSDELEAKFFTDKDDNIIAKINGTHCIVHAKIMT